jgi:hypothetical protein
MYNNGNSSKNVTGASVVDGTLYTVDIADDAVTADKLANTVNADIATGVSGSTTAGDALPKAGGAMTGAITTNSTFDGVDVATRDAVLTTTTNTANAALPKAGGTMTGTIADFTSTGIDDNATSIAVTINSAENVGIGTAATDSRLQVTDGTAGLRIGYNNTSVNFYDANTHNFRDSVGNVRNVIDSSGHILAGTGVTLGNGTTYAAANTLDDYEEGTWTPVLSDGTNNATMSSDTLGTYEKIGRQVTVRAFVRTTSLGSVTGGVRITGLPFTSANVDNTYGVLNVSYGSSLSLTSGQSIGGYIGDNFNYMHLQKWSGIYGTQTMTDAQWTADGSIMIESIYFV